MRLNTTPQRSRMMSNIRSRNTRPEQVIRAGLFAMGFRYRLHVRTLPGTPDLVFPKYRAVVFVHGCFWHQHAGCKYAATPKSNAQFWHDKLSGNVARDARTEILLHDAGWRIAIIWECGLRHQAESTVHTAANWLKGNEPRMELGFTPRAQTEGSD